MVQRICACALLLLAAGGGCRMCQSYTDCAPVVPDGPYSHISGRAGSILSGGAVPLPTILEEPIPSESLPQQQ